MASHFQQLITSCKTCKHAPIFRDGMCHDCFRKFTEHTDLWALDRLMEKWYGE